MPELPDIDLYVAKIDAQVNGRILNQVRIRNPFLVRSVDPPLASVHGKRVAETRRVGKRIAIGLQDELWLILHLMIAGRLRWHDREPQLTGKQQLAAFDFSSGSLLLTEAGTKKRASLYLLQGENAWREHDPGGIEPLTCCFEEFAASLVSENKTLKRALTNPRTFSGIGNAYSDEILHAAGLSPMQHTRKLTVPEQRILYAATRDTLHYWRHKLQKDCVDKFPGKVTAFKEDMAVHGKFGKPCPRCGTSVQRIRYKNTETNYCPACQTGGRILADRSLSRLLKDGWPDSL